MAFTRFHPAMLQLALLLLVVGKIKGGSIPVEDAKPAFLNHGKTFELKSGVIADLFMWRWTDVADECEQFLSKKGFDGVQISPPAEHVDSDNIWSRYQVVSYQLVSHLGSENQLRNMVKRCNNVGVRVFVDVVLNHMTEVTKNRVGVGGSSFYPEDMYYPSVPYTKEDFYPPCEIKDPSNRKQIRECPGTGLNNLNQSLESVREKIVHYLNHLIEIGVAGFRLNFANEMYPEDLSVIYERLNYLNTARGFPAETRPLIYQDVFVLDNAGPIKYEEYSPLGLVLDFKFGLQLGTFFLGKKDLKDLQDFDSEASILPKNLRVVFVDNNITERMTDKTFLSYKNPKAYKMAVVFMLARGDYTCKIFSSFQFLSIDEGPPALPPHPIKKNICSNKWECQHRWRQIYNAVEFHNVVKGTPVTSWWSNGKNQIAFCRGDKGFVAFNLDSVELNVNLQTCLPEGEYCDIISGEVTTTGCSGKVITVNKDGIANVVVPKFDPGRPDEDGVVAIHIQSGTVYGLGNWRKSEM
ncbi:alpha-amylase-like [Macrosteles quadrilineatus]|uniref:alpha-amylase-like n=1 Tax=Macrosteles quadrilineatus TaxID=74068 RepID=UPI0023E1E3B1|nr:alpha-amylase-like [Macrosteles quadrilineatus]